MSHPPRARRSRTLRSVLARWGVVAMALVALAACAGRIRTPAPTDAAPRPALSAWLPSGPGPVLVARPELMFRASATDTLWSALVDAERERAFVQRTGVDPRTLAELVAREDGQGYLVLARGPFDAVGVVRAAGARLALPDVATDAPYVRREGLAGQGRYAYAALAPDTVLVARDVPPQRVAQVLALVDASVGTASSGTAASGAAASGAAGLLPSVLSEEPVRSLAVAYVHAPFALFVPAHLELPAGTPLALLLAEQRALVAVAEPSGSRVALSVELRGEFPPGAAANFRTLGHSMAQSELMRMLGLGPTLAALEVLEGAQSVRLRGAVEAIDVAAGLRALFFADARDLFGN